MRLQRECAAAGVESRPAHGRYPFGMSAPVALSLQSSMGVFASHGARFEAVDVDVVCKATPMGGHTCAVNAEDAGTQLILRE